MTSASTMAGRFTVGLDRIVLLARLGLFLMVLFLLYLVRPVVFLFKSGIDKVDTFHCFLPNVAAMGSMAPSRGQVRDHSHWEDGFESNTGSDEGTE